MSDFHIVKRTKDWAKHDQDLQADALKALSDNAAVADERELSKAAERFQPSDDLLLAINAAIAVKVDHRDKGILQSMRAQN